MTGEAEVVTYDAKMLDVLLDELALAGSPLLERIIAARRMTVRKPYLKVNRTRQVD